MLINAVIGNISVPMGGGFGGKRKDITVETYIACLSKKLADRLRWFGAEKSLLKPMRSDIPNIFTIRPFTKDGKIIAQQVSIVLDGGSYTYLTPWVQMYSTYAVAGPYKIPNVKIESVSAFTNNTLSSANRGFGSPQVNFAYERQMDHWQINWEYHGSRYANAILCITEMRCRRDLYRAYRAGRID